MPVPGKDFHLLGVYAYCWTNYCIQGNRTNMIGQARLSEGDKVVLDSGKSLEAGVQKYALPHLVQKDAFPMSFYFFLLKIIC